jgi:hypothetical protein
MGSRIVLTCTAFMGKNALHFFMYLLAICTSFENYLLNSSAHLLIGLSDFWCLLLWSCWVLQMSSCLFFNTPCVSAQGFEHLMSTLCIEVLTTCILSVNIVSMFKQDILLSKLRCYFSVLHWGYVSAAKYSPTCSGNQPWFPGLTDWGQLVRVLVEASFVCSGLISL